MRKQIEALKQQKQDAVQAARQVAEAEMQKRAEEAHRAEEARKVAEAAITERDKELDALRTQLAASSTEAVASGIDHRLDANLAAILHKFQEVSDKRQREYLEQSERRQQAMLETLLQANNNSRDESYSVGSSNQQNEDTVRQVNSGIQKWEAPVLKAPCNLTLQMFRSWKLDWEYYVLTRHLNQEPNPRIRIGVLRGALHEDWKELWDTGKLDIKTQDDTEVIVQKMNDYLRRKRNALLDRKEFTHRNQHQGETVDKYHAALKLIDQSCAYDDPVVCPSCKQETDIVCMNCEALIPLADLQREIRIRDRIICGLQSEVIRKEVLKVPLKQLTLQKVLEICEAEESSEYTEANLYGKVPAHGLHVAKSSYKKDKENTMKVCSYCGKAWHKRDECPAREAECKHCKKIGHYHRMCRLKKRNQLQSSKDHLGYLGGYMVGDSNIGDVSMIVQARKEAALNFICDSGATIEAVGVKHLHALGEDKGSLLKDNLKVDTANGIAKSLGKFKATLCYQGQTRETELRVFPKLKVPLLSRHTCAEMGIIPNEWRNAMIHKLSVLEPKEAISANMYKQHNSSADLEKSKLLSENWDVFNDEKLGTMSGPPMKIKLIDGAIPCKRLKAYTIPLSWRYKVKAQLDSMVEKGVIEKVPVGETYSWCHPMVVVPKKNLEELRITVDFKGLNKYVERPAHPTHSPKDMVSQIKPGCKYFTTLDSRHGYWQIKLDEKSKPLTTFMTEWGAYRFERNVMGLISAGDEHNRRGDEALNGIENVKKVVEDILIYDSDYNEHIKRVKEVISKCREHGITLNPKKFVFAQPIIEWCGYKISEAGYTVSDDLIKALKHFPEPKTKTDVRSFAGLVQQFGKFSPDIAGELKQLSHLISPKVNFVWEEPQRRSFQKLIELLTNPRILAQYDPEKPVCLETDAAQSRGMGYALWQQQKDKTWRLMQCGSRAVSDTEARYSATEIELQAVVHAVEKCRLFLLGRAFDLIVDHKPLVPLINDKTLNEIDNRRIQRQLSKLANYQITARWREGKLHKVVDAFSRYPVDQPSTEDLQGEVETDAVRIAVHMVSLEDEEDGHSIMEDKLIKTVKMMSQRDSDLQELKTLILDGFPDHKSQLNSNLKGYWKIQAELSIEDDMILNGQRIVIPRALRKQILENLHAPHLGEKKTLARARQCVYWPGIGMDIKQKVQACNECALRQRSLGKESIIQEEIPKWPFYSVAADLFSYAGKEHMVYTDKLSGWYGVRQFRHSANTDDVTSAMEDFFINFGVPVKLTTDGGPQFTSMQFAKFCKDWSICHDMSSPHHPQGNGHAESAVKRVKGLMAKTTKTGNMRDKAFIRGVLEHRNTPREDGKSPAELVLGRPLRALVPMHHSKFEAGWKKIQAEVDAKATILKERAQKYYNQGARDLKELKLGSIVRIQDHNTKLWNRIGEVVRTNPERRNYWIRTESGRVLRRNRRFLRPCNMSKETADKSESNNDVTSPELRRSQRIAKKPNWYRP